MQIIVICLFFFVIANSQSFFLQNKDLKKLLQYFPKAFEVETNHRQRPVHYRHRENDNRYRDEYAHDNHDRSYDNGEHRRSTVKIPRGKTGRIHNDKALYQSHIDCDHPDHHHHHHNNKYPEDRVEKHHNKNSEEMGDRYYHNERNYQESKKKVTVQNDKDYEQNVYEKIAQDKHGNLNYKNKDYVTGVLITIPKIKNDEDVNNYYKEKQQNVFFQQLLKSNEDEEDHIPSSSSYLY